MKKIKFFLDDVAQIFSSHRRITCRWKILGYHIRFTIKQLLSPKATQETFLGFTVHFADYPYFYAMWKEVFVAETYCLPPDKPDHPKILDLGSNIGMTILYFKYVWPDANVIAFEPADANWKYLVKNVGHLTGLTLKPHAVGKENGKIKLFEHDTPSVTNSIWESHSDGGLMKEVVCEGLQSYLPVDFLKCDIEGAEYDALIGVDLKGTDVLMVECHQPEGKDNAPLHQLLTDLDRQGYRYAFMSIVRAWSFVKNPVHNCILLAKKA